MTTNDLLEVKKLSLDLKNYRTTPQKSESSAIKAMISIKPERFYAVMESILEDGYLHTENIIVLKEGQKLIVKEGNRRVAILKILHGIYSADSFGIPDSIKTHIAAITNEWKKDNLKIPCSIYDSKDVDKVDRIVTLAHGKGEKASRDPWNSVAKARHNRDVRKSPEPGLDLLEKYLKQGQNLNAQQKDRWGGEYHLTVLDEAILKIYPRFGVASVTDLVTKYPKIKMSANLEDLLRDIGLNSIGFDEIRDQQHDFGLNYQINPIAIPNNTSPGNTSNTRGSKQASGNSNSGNANQNPNNTTPTGSSQSTGSTGSKSTKAYALNDPKSVTTALRKFTPKGKNREKVVTLKQELLKLKVKDNPIAFCFILRSMFEISAHAYCKDHSIAMTKIVGKGTVKKTYDKTLAELLKDVTNHLTNNKANKAKVKILQGAITEIANPDRILSVTSMNNLVHSAKFSVSPNDICSLFNKIFPLLEEMN